MSNTTVIDGSYGEGGRQIICTSLSLAAVTGKAVEISTVRAGRSRPDLLAPLATRRPNVPRPTT